jgi:Mg/Co/Ni transporter MgtE
MGVDFLALPEHSTAARALQAIHEATTTQPEALATVYALSPEARLCGAIGLVTLLQADPAATLHTIADPDPVHVPAHADLIEIATVMADYNLPTLPVVDDQHHLLGVITVDDVLEASIPANWRHREPAAHHHHSTDTEK